MDALQLLDHLLNFLAPALVVGAVLAVVAPLFIKNTARAPTFRRQAAFNCGAGVLALLIGLVFFGHDGKMATYAAMVLACGTSQWLGGRGWR